MNTPPPEPVTNGNGNGVHAVAARSSAGASYAGSVHIDSDDEGTHTPRPQVTKGGLPPRNAVHCACGQDGEGGVALLLRTIDFAAWVSLLEDVADK